MGALSGWAVDFAVLGLTTGAMAALAPVVFGTGGGQPIPWSLMGTAALLIGVVASVAGVAAGVTLRAQHRSKGHPLVAIFLSAMAASFCGSMLTAFASEVPVLAASAHVLLGRAGVLSLMVLLSVPLLAVLRWRRERTWTWMVVFGILAGLGVQLG
jgi:hypothetical protein